MAEHKKTENRIVQETTAPQATYELGEQLGKQAQPGQIYCLDGELGVGKTVFAQGFAAGLGISEPVSSPTFTILQQYEEGRLSLYHFDVYRISDPEEMEEIGYEDYFYGQGVCLIEWSTLIEELLPEGAVRVRLEKDLARGFDFRRIVIQSEKENFALKEENEDLAYEDIGD